MPVKQGVRILLVEDEEAVATVTARLILKILDAWRPQVDVIATCEDAFTHARALRDANWRLVTDYNTPGGMTGDGLMVALDDAGLGGGRMLRYCGSGHGNSAVIEELGAGTQVRTVHKPASMADLKLALEWLIE